MAFGFPALALGQTHIWSGDDAGSTDWSAPGNWHQVDDEDNPPDNPATELVLFGRGTSGSQQVSDGNNRVDQNWVLQGGLHFHPQSPATYVPRTEIPNNVTLTVDGGDLRMGMGNGRHAIVDIFGDGTFQLGSLDNVVTQWRVGVRSQGSSEAEVTISSTVNVVGLTDLIIALNGTQEGQFANGELDLRSAAFTGDTFQIGGNLDIADGFTTNGTLRLPSGLETLQTRNLRMAFTSQGGFGSVALLDFDSAPELTLIVEKDFIMARGEDRSASVINLPDTLHVQIGEAMDRGLLHVGFHNQTNAEDPDVGAAASFISPQGTLSAYLTELRIGQNLEGDGNATGVFDFSASDLDTLDISDNGFIGVGLNGDGDLRLAGGNAQSQNLTLGDSAAGSSGRLDLDGTIWSIQDTLTIGASGQANVMVGLASAGFDLTSDEAFQFDIAMGGVIEAPFEELVQAWAVRMLGDQTTLFDQYVGDGRLVASGTYGSYAEVFFDGTHTVFGIIPEPGVVSLILVGLGSLLLGRRCPCRRAQ